MTINKSELLAGILSKLDKELLPIRISASHPRTEKKVWEGRIEENFREKDRFAFPKFPHTVLLKFEFGNGDIRFVPYGSKG